MRVPTVALILPAFALLLLVQNPGVAQQVDEDERRKTAGEMLDLLPDSQSLRWNVSQLQSWARYNGDEVLPRLLEIYQKPPGPFDVNMRYLAAAAFRNRYDIPTGGDDDMRRFVPRMEPSEADIKALRKFVKANYKRAEEIWGVYCAACILAIEDDTDIGLELLQIVGDKRAPGVIRAAMIEALAHGGFEYLRRALELLLQEDFKKTEGTLLYEAICWAAARAYRPEHEKDKAVNEDWRPIFDRITAIMGDEDTEARSIREAALALQFCFETKYPYQYPSMWELLFRNGLDPLGDDDGNTAASFMGLDVMGDRIVFLVDASDSMLNPLSDEDLEALKNPITGDKRKRKDKGAYEIDWDRVKTRFDAAREHVKWTVSRLGKDKQVSVILFGDRVEPLGATNGFISASAINARRIQASLDSIHPKKPSEEMESKRPNGVLLGETNYYTALLSAYRMGRGGILNAPREGYDLKLITEGADAIFLLSDGAPIRDGFAGDTPTIEREYTTWAYYSSHQPGEGEWVEFPATKPRPESEYERRDPETGAITKVKVPAQPGRPASRMWRKREKVKTDSHFHHDNGPYASVGGMSFGITSELQNLLDEIERMNVVRRVRIQSVGIGEAQMGWLKPIAIKTAGKSVYFGKDGQRNADDDIRDALRRAGKD